MKFKYSDDDVVGNLEIKGLGITSKSGVRLYSVLCLLCGSVTDKRLQTIERAKSCGCMQSKRDIKPCGSGRKTAEWTRFEINTLISIYKSNARKRGIPFDLTYIQFETLVDSECYFCGDTGGNTLRKKGYNEYSYTGIDRIDNSVGYLPSNCISCCSWCNRAKNNGTLANFVDKCKKITSRIELDDNYFNIAEKRIQEAVDNKENNSEV